MGIIETVISETKSRMDKTRENLKKDFLRIRTGRATPALLDGITVDYYGSSMPLNQVATVSIPDARTVSIQPWEKSMVAPIEKTIQASDLGLNPQSDGNIIRLPIPPLSEERRKELVKTCKKISEDNKVAVRNIRRDSNEKLKKAEKDKDITQDECKKELEKIQELTDAAVSGIDEQLALKEKEVLEI